MVILKIKTMRKLAVYNNDVLAGILEEKSSGHGYVFRYDSLYLKEESVPISLTLPIRSEAFESESLFPFFANMVPEGANRRLVCRNLRIDEADLFGLLCAMAGKDFIGAVNVRKI